LNSFQWVMVIRDIPLTAPAKRDDYDWGFLAYAVGYGVMNWFVSAGVAIR
jgi:hypothetical protein